jgi:Leucine-rich repeat (LRR) protein
MSILNVIYTVDSSVSFRNYGSMKELQKDTAIHNSITEITIMNYKEDEIVDCFNLFPNLKDITVTNTDIKIIPSTLENAGNLEKMTLVMNKICILGSTFGAGLPKLKWLDLQMNDIHAVPDSIAEMSQLEFLNLNNNAFRNFPDAVTRLPKLKTLMINSNKIKVIPSHIKYAKSLQEFNIYSNRLSKIPDEIGDLVELRRLILTDNVINTLPGTIGNLVNLVVLDVGNNVYLETLPKRIRGCSRLRDLNVENNNLKTLPIELVECRRLNKVRYYGNPIELSPVLNRFFDLMNNYDQHAGFYADRQNVHNTSIQHSIKGSLINLLNDPTNYKKNDVVKSIVEDPSITTKNKELLVTYINDDKETHSTLFCSFYDAFSKVYGRIRAAEQEKQAELYKRLNEELGEGECLCFTGRLSRMVNVLNGFYDDIQLTISSNEQIANVILAIRMRHGLKTDDDLTDETKDKIREELKERGYEDDIIEVWLNV